MRIAVFLFGIAIAFSFARAEVIIELKDGGRIRGNIIGQDQKSITIQNRFGEMEILRSRILRVRRIAQKILPYFQSKYSFKKRSWTKYAMLASIAVGIPGTVIVANATTNFLLPTMTALFFATATLTFYALDFFLYGRVPKKSRKKLSFRHSPLYVAKKPLAMGRKPSTPLMVGTTFRF